MFLFSIFILGRDLNWLKNCSIFLGSCIWCSKQENLLNENFWKLHGLWNRRDLGKKRVAAMGKIKFERSKDHFYNLGKKGYWKSKKQSSRKILRIFKVRHLCISLQLSCGVVCLMFESARSQACGSLPISAEPTFHDFDSNAIAKSPGKTTQKISHMKPVTRSSCNSQVDVNSETLSF